MSQGRILPIRFVDQAGFETTNFVGGQPLINIGFMYDPLYGSAQLAADKPRNISGFSEVLALIDTGSDGIYADPSLISKHACPLVRTTNLIGGTGVIPANKYECHLVMRHIGRQIKAEVTAVSLKGQGQLFPLILGRKFLEFGILHMDFQAKSFSFTLA